jgi:hypothetical protein
MEITWFSFLIGCIITIIVIPILIILGENTKKADELDKKVYKHYRDTHKQQ